MKDRVLQSYAPYAVIALLIFAIATPTVLAQANVHGQWSTLPYLMPINPVHVALMYNGKVLVVSGSGNDPSNITCAPRSGIRRPGPSPYKLSPGTCSATAWWCCPTGGRSSMAARCSTTRFTDRRNRRSSIPPPTLSPTSRTWRTAAGIPP